MQHRDEKMPSGDTAFAASKDRPPEQYGSQQKAQMLQAMHCDIDDGGIEQQRRMPGPYRDTVEQCRVSARAQPLPGSSYRRAPQKAAHRYPDAPRHGPKERTDRSGHHQQRSRDGHQDFVLNHVKGKKMFTQPMQGRHQRQCERKPSREYTPPSAIPGPCGRPQFAATASTNRPRKPRRQ